MTTDLTPEALAAFLEDGPVHNWDCDRFQTYDHGLRQGTCDCMAEATVRALIAALTEARANVAHLRGEGREDTAWNEMKRQRDEARAEVERLTREQDTVTFLRAGSIIRERDAAEARLAAVRALHQPNSWADHLCECGQPEPCATARAMDGTP